PTTSTRLARLRLSGAARAGDEGTGRLRHRHRRAGGRAARAGERIPPGRRLLLADGRERARCLAGPLSQGEIPPSGSLPEAARSGTGAMDRSARPDLAGAEGEV